MLPTTVGISGAKLSQRPIMRVQAKDELADNHIGIVFCISTALKTGHAFDYRVIMTLGVSWSEREVMDLWVLFDRAYRLGVYVVHSD
jgi:hypothetical protein